MSHYFYAVAFLFIVHLTHAHSPYPFTAHGNMEKVQIENSPNQINFFRSNWPISPQPKGNYNEIPNGVKLVESEEEWLRMSPYKPCCCYPEFDEKNKSYGLLYNNKAYLLIKGILSGSATGSSVCTEEDWTNILDVIKKDKFEFGKMGLNFYPGYFDEVWYSKNDNICSYWMSEYELVTFSHDAFAEPMVDEITDDRITIAALSIRLNKSGQNLCKEDKWIVEPILPRGNDNVIKLITNASDWDKYSSKKPCCCFLNFDLENEDYGLLYNSLALIELNNDEKLKKDGYRIATKKEWDEILNCRVSNNSYKELFSCENEYKNGFFISPNGFYGNDGWHLPEEGKSYFRFLNDGVGYSFDCATKSHLQIKTNLTGAYFVKFIKLQ